MNITQKELSDRLDMDDGSLRRIESGRTNPTLETINKIATAFCIPIWGMFVTNKDLHLLQNFYSEDKNTKKNS